MLRPALAQESRSPQGFLSKRNSRSHGLWIIAKYLVIAIDSWGQGEAFGYEMVGWESIIVARMLHPYKFIDRNRSPVSQKLLKISNQLTAYSVNFLVKGDLKASTISVFDTPSSTNSSAIPVSVLSC